MKSGLFLSFEGIDGAGKSTHIEALAQAFRATGRQLVQTREPGGTPLSEKLRELALNAPMDALTEALLMFAARREHLVQVIAPALARGDVVLCDRYTDATMAYQGFGRGFSMDSLVALERLVQRADDFAPLQRAAQVLEPDLTVWFDIAPHVAAHRLAGARVPDKFESQPQAFFERVRAGYAARAAAAPGRFAVINADQSRERVWDEVLAVVQARGMLEPTS